MKETEAHQKAFENFFECRNTTEVARKAGVTRKSVSGWKKAFCWDDRCMLREKEINKGIDEKFVAGVVDKKAKMLQELDNLDIMVDQEIITAFEKDETGKVVPKLHAEKLKDLIDLFKLRLLINDNRLKVIGEDIHRIEIAGALTHVTDIEETLEKYGHLVNEPE